MATADRRRPTQLVAIPFVVMGVGLAALVAVGPSDEPDELVSLPGVDRLSPDRPAVTSTSAPGPGATSTTEPGDGPIVITIDDREAEPDDRVVLVVDTTPSLGDAPGSDRAGPGDGPPGSSSTSTTTAPTPPPPATDAVFEHTYSKDHEGPVWVRVFSLDGRQRDVLIRWGPYQRAIVHRSIWPVTYVFDKGAGPTVPTTVTVSDGAGVSVTFGEGDGPPLGSVDVNDGWTVAPGEAPPP